RAGEWIRTLRVLIGLLELGAAIKFVANADLVLGWGLFTRPAVLASWAVLALICAIYLVRISIRKSDRSGMRPASFLPAAAASIVAAWLAMGIAGRPLRAIDAFLPPASNGRGVSRTTAQGESWILNDYDGALGAARANGKLVFIDFTGYTCTNCRWMEANIFSRPDVGAELGKFVLSRLYTDGDGALYERQQAFQEQTFGTVALPLYAIVDGKGNVRATFSGLTRNAAEFIDFLRKGDAPRVASVR
ncbi:MAG TPA: thioredoxin family protein, partial [Gemmatimonadaceae bacterium]